MRGKKIDPEKRDMLKLELLRAGDNPNINDISKSLHMPNQTAYTLARDILSDDDFIKAKDEFKKQTISKLNELASAALIVSLSKIDTASSASAATIAAIAIDKAQLLRGEPTIITKDDVTESKLVELNTQMQELLIKHPHLASQVS